MDGDGDDKYDEVQQRLSYDVTNVKSTPSSSTSSLCHINMKFKFEIKILELDSRQIDETIHDDSACVAINISQGILRKRDIRFLTQELYIAVQSILTCLPVSRNDHIVRWACGKAFNLFVERWDHGGKVPLDLDLDMLVRIQESIVIDLEDNDDDNDLIPASDSSVRLLLRKLEIDTNNNGGGESRCCICLEELKSDEELLSMPCEHAFHDNCIKEWLTTGHHCPVCRFRMPTS